MLKLYRVPTWKVAAHRVEAIQHPVVSAIETGIESLVTAHARAPERKPVPNDLQTSLVATEHAGRGRRNLSLRLQQQLREMCVAR